MNQLLFVIAVHLIDTAVENGRGKVAPETEKVTTEKVQSVADAQGFG